MGRKDLRRWDPTPDPAAVAEARDLFARSRALDLRLSRVLARIETKGAHKVEGAATIAEFAQREGFDGLRATELARLGRAVEKKPEIAPKLASGEITLSNAAVVAPMFLEPELQKPGENWVEKATEGKPKDLRREVRYRLEEARQGVAVLLPLTVLVSQETSQEFGRVRDLASRSEKRQLSESQTFAWMTRHCVRYLDPVRKPRRRRRMPPTGERTDKRGVAAETTREIVARSGLRCEVPGCTRMATEKAHVRPHARGSGREARDLWDACHAHHVMFDVAKTLRVTGWTPGGKPIFVFRGRPVRARPQTPRGPPPAERPRQHEPRPPES